MSPPASDAMKVCSSSTTHESRSPEVRAMVRSMPENDRDGQRDIGGDSGRARQVPKHRRILCDTGAQRASRQPRPIADGIRTIIGSQLLPRIFLPAQPWDALAPFDEDPLLRCCHHVIVRCSSC